MAWVGQRGHCMAKVMILIRSSRKSCAFGLGFGWWWSLFSMLDFLRCGRRCRIVGQRLEAFRVSRLRRARAGLIRSCGRRRKHRHSWPRIACLAILIGGILHRHILELLNDWTHEILMCSWGQGPVEYFHLPSFHQFFDGVHKGSCIRGCPKVYVDRMQPK